MGVGRNTSVVTLCSFVVLLEAMGLGVFLAWLGVVFPTRLPMGPQVGLVSRGVSGLRVAYVGYGI